MLRSNTGDFVPPDWGPTVSILVVEEDKATADLERAILNKEPGWGATVVHDAAAAREVFRHVRVEALVVNTALHGISGLELLSLLRKDAHWHDPPVVLLADAQDERQAEAAVKAGDAAACVVKPFDVDALTEAVASALAGHVSRPRLVAPAAAPRAGRAKGGDAAVAAPVETKERDPAPSHKTYRHGLRLLESPAATPSQADKPGDPPGR